MGGWLIFMDLGMARRIWNDDLFFLRAMFSLCNVDQYFDGHILLFGEALRFASFDMCWLEVFLEVFAFKKVWIIGFFVWTFAGKKRQSYCIVNIFPRWESSFFLLLSWQETPTRLPLDLFRTRRLTTGSPQNHTSLTSGKSSEPMKQTSIFGFHVNFRGF